MKIPKTWQILAAVGSLVLFPLANAPAAVITWGSVQTIDYNTPTQVSTNGTYLDSFKFQSILDNPVNGVTFNPFSSTVGTVASFVGSGITVDLGTNTADQRFGASDFNSPVNNAYSRLVGTTALVLQPADAQISLIGLTSGFTYEIQLWQGPWDNLFQTRYSSSSDFTTGLSGVLDSGSSPQFVLGSFTANAATQSIYFQSTANSFVAGPAAGQLRVTAIPEPASFALVGVALMVILAWRRNVSRRRLA